MVCVNKRYVHVIILLCMFSLLVTGCYQKNDREQLDQNETEREELANDPSSLLPEPPIESLPPGPPVKIEEEEEKEAIFTAKLAAIGDVLIHGSIYRYAKTESGYDFVPIFEPVRSYIEEADIAIANQESMIGGTEIGLSDYPQFNSPFEVGDALKEIGIDVVNMANNHTLDRGEKAILNAIGHWRKLGLIYTGAYESEADKSEMRLVQKNGITFSFLSYTYGTNGIRIPKDKPYLVNLIDLEQMKLDIAEAKKASDVVIINAHFGQEYVLLPNDEQRKFVQVAAEAGAHIILGHHPHVLQPVEWVETEHGHRTFVVYSLGNFIAAQEGKYKRTGGILQLEVEKKVKGDQVQITIQHPALIPTWISMTNWRNYEVVHLQDAPDKQLPDKEKFIQEIQKHMSRWVEELVFR